MIFDCYIVRDDDDEFINKITATSFKKAAVEAYKHYRRICEATGCTQYLKFIDKDTIFIYVRICQNSINGDMVTDQTNRIFRITVKEYPVKFSSALFEDSDNYDYYLTINELIKN